MEPTSWIYENQPNEQAVSALQQDAGLSFLVASLMVQRGMADRDVALAFLHPDLKSLHDPSLMTDLDVAADRLHTAISEGERIMVYGDYDVDGATSVALLASNLKGAGANVVTYVPHRYQEGYGVSPEGVARAVKLGCSVMVTLDCGSKDFIPLKLAKTAGIDTIVCDHHVPDDVLPETFAMLNPKRKDCHYPFSELSGCGVALKLLQALRGRLGLTPDDILDELDLVAISIGADLVDVVGENRVLAYHGMQRLTQVQRPGIRAMLRAAAIHQAPRTLRDISFTLGPRINAAGRMGHAQLAVDLLMSTNEQKAGEVARELEVLNRERRTVDEAITRKAIQKVEEYGDKNAFCNLVWGKDWHRGVVGIVASRLVEHRHRPSIVLSEEAGVLIGSARSVEGVDLHAAFDSCADLLDQYGGHPMAAGLSMKKSNLPAFQERLEEAIKKQLDGELPDPAMCYDMELGLSDLSMETLREIEQLEPFGPQNPTPIFMTRRVACSRPAKTVGTKGRHIKLTLKDADHPEIAFEAVGFGMGEMLGKVNNWPVMDIMFTLVKNSWRDRSWRERTELNLHLKAIRPSAAVPDSQAKT